MDRNNIALASMRVSITSLSARRAWIEILHDVSLNYKEVVALRKESVDRNFVGLLRTFASLCRSPQGERG